MIRPERIRAAADAIRKKVVRTPLVHSPTLSDMFSGDIYLKLENLQRTGSFKIRGAVFKLMACADRIGPKGVVAASAGNHAQGVAFAAAEARVPSTIVMPEWASISKQEATRHYGGKVVLHGQSVSESLTHAMDLSGDGRMFVHPFDDPEIIAGQGTVGLEILEELPDVDTIIVSVGGGGLVSGIATAVKEEEPGVKIIGVEAAVCPSAAVSLEKGTMTTVDAASSIADGILVRKPGELTFPLMQRFVDRIALVEEEHIASAILLLLERKKMLSEGAGAAPLAALVGGGVDIPSGRKSRAGCQRRECGQSAVGADHQQGVEPERKSGSIDDSAQ